MLKIAELVPAPWRQRIVGRAVGVFVFAKPGCWTICASCVGCGGENIGQSSNYECGFIVRFWVVFFQFLRE